MLVTNNIDLEGIVQVDDDGHRVPVVKISDVNDHITVTMPLTVLKLMVAGLAEAAKDKHFSGFAVADDYGHEVNFVRSDFGKLRRTVKRLVREARKQGLE